MHDIASPSTFSLVMRLAQQPHRASRLVQAPSARSVKTRRAFRLGVVAMRGSMVLRPRPCMTRAYPPAPPLCLRSTPALPPRITRPYDARMWIAMGQCLEKLEKRGEAISTYERVRRRRLSKHFFSFFLLFFIFFPSVLPTKSWPTV